MKYEEGKARKKYRYKLTGNMRNRLTIIMLLIPALFTVLPIVLLLTGSVMDQYELKGYLNSIFTDGLEFISWKLMPDYPTFENYGRLLFVSPQFFVLFWNSIKMTAWILSGQLLAEYTIGSYFAGSIFYFSCISLLWRISQYSGTAL